MVGEESGGAAEVVEGEPFVEFVEDFGIGSFEANGDFEARMAP